MKLRLHPKNVTPKKIVITMTPITTVRPNFRILETMNLVALAWAAIQNYQRRCHHRHHWHHRRPVRKCYCHLHQEKRNVDDPYRGNRNWSDAVARHHQQSMSTKIMQKRYLNHQLTTIDRNVIRGGIFWFPIISSIGDSIHTFFCFVFVFIIFSRRTSHCVPIAQSI